VTALPPGAESLDADQLARILADGDHPETRAHALTDEQLVEPVRAGFLAACRLEDGRIAFTRTELADQLLAELEAHQ
jgi:hypothetical protein